MNTAPSLFVLLPKKCFEYVNCQNGQEVNVQSCSVGTAFDLTIIACNWEDLVTCPPDEVCDDTAASVGLGGTGNITSVEGGDPTPSPTNDPKALNQDVISMKFNAFGLPSPSDVNEGALKQEMVTILELILFQLAEEHKALTILEVEIDGDVRRRRRRLGGLLSYWESKLRGGDYSRRTATASTPYAIAADANQQRSLQNNIPYELTFDIIILHKDGIDFGPIIINAIRESHAAIVRDIRDGWAKYDYINDNFDFNLCAEDAMGSEVCSSDGGSSTSSSIPVEYPTYESSSSTLSNSTMDEKDGTFPVWAIIVIVVISFLILCCIGSIILLVGCHTPETPEEHKEYYENNNLQMRHRRSRGRQGHPRYQQDRGFFGEQSEGESSGSSYDSDDSSSVSDESSSDGSSQYHERDRLYVDDVDGGLTGRDPASIASGAYTPKTGNKKLYRPDPSIKSHRVGKDPSLYDEGTYASETIGTAYYGKHDASMRSGKRSIQSRRLMSGGERSVPPSLFSDEHLGSGLVTQQKEEEMAYREKAEEYDDTPINLSRMERKLRDDQLPRVNVRADQSVVSEMTNPTFFRYENDPDDDEKPSVYS
eukprot:scaffold13354_cov181-Alexandrium_tamarense.AAC.3